MVSMRAPFPSPARSAASRRPASSMSRWTIVERSCQAPQAPSLMEETVPANNSHTRKGPVWEERSGSCARGGSVGAALPPVLWDREGPSPIQARSARVLWMLPEYRWEESRLFSATRAENGLDLHTADHTTPPVP